MNLHSALANEGKLIKNITKLLELDVMVVANYYKDMNIENNGMFVKKTISYISECKHLTERIDRTRKIAVNNPSKAMKQLPTIITRNKTLTTHLTQLHEYIDKLLYMSRHYGDTRTVTIHAHASEANNVLSELTEQLLPAMKEVEAQYKTAK